MANPLIKNRYWLTGYFFQTVSGLVCIQMLQQLQNDPPEKTFFQPNMNFLNPKMKIA
jgi:hypothetical protein